MAEIDGGAVQCPSCGASYRWRAAFAGKALRCKCGASFRPEAPAAPNTAPPPAVSSYAEAMGRKSSIERALETGEDEAQPSRIRELHLPLIVMPVGWFGGAVFWWNVCETSLAAAVVIAAALVLQLVVFVPAMLVAIVKVAQWFEVNMGTLGWVLFKCTALTLGPAAAVDPLFTWMMAIADFDWWLLAAGYAYYLIGFGILAAIVFEMNIYQAALTTAFIFVPRVVVVYGAALALPEFFISRGV
ncbi:MAG: hypothetical protein ACODAQ_13205 [Phycisphaeraceae bacterium]